MEKYQNRNQVPEEQKWDLTFLLDNKSLDEQIANLVKLEKYLITIKDQKYESKDAFKDALIKEDQSQILFNKIINYLTNWQNENVIKPEPNQILEKFQYQMYQLNLEKGPEIPRIFANEAKIKLYLKDESLKNYRSFYADIFRTKKHQLPKKIQEFENIANHGYINTINPFGILTNAELQFEAALDSKGKKHVVNHTTISNLTKSLDAKLRKNATLSYRQGYWNVKQTLANFLYQHFKNITVKAKLHKYKSTLDYLLFDDQVSEKLLLSLYEATQKNLKSRHQAKMLHKKIYQAKYGKKITKFDYQVPLVKTNDKYSVAEHKATVLAALKPMGEEYYQIANKALDEKWVDFSSYPNKITGAYSIGQSYGLSKKLILMNDDQSFRSTETLAHELGHSMHSYFSDQNQHIREADYKIFVAEIASIFNELMLFDHVLKTTTNKKLKMKILQQMVEGFEGTVFRQIEWSNYEYNLYQEIEKGKPLATFEALSAVYQKNAEKYQFDKKVDFKDKEAFSAIRVPHYYYEFYVYKYAIGQLCANIFFQRYLDHGQEALKDFINNFLSMGNKLKPLELLKHNNIDLEDPQTYELGFKVFKETIDKLKQVAKEIYPNL